MKFKHKASFSSQIFPSKEIPQFEEHKSQAIASLQEILPYEDNSVQNVDLLPVAFDAAVINKFNKNDDGMAAHTAAAVRDFFIHRPINVEHDRQKIIGHITNAGFTDISSHEYLWSFDALAKEDPFYLSLGGFVYKIVDQDYVAQLENSMSANSEMYKSISASWEVGFNTFGIALGSEFIKDCEIITNPIQVAEFAKYLRSFGGDGVTEDGMRVYRLIMGEVYPLGIGFVESPAADVKGIETRDESYFEKDSELAAKKAVFIANKDPDISQSEKSNVKSLDKNKPTMDLLTQLKEALAAEKKISEEVVANLTAKFADAIREGDKKYQEEIEAQKELARIADEESEELKSSVAEMKEKLQDATDKIEEFESEKKEHALAEARLQRLEAIDSLYKLDDEERKVVLDDLSNIDVTSDEEFEVYANKLAVIWKSKTNEAIAEHDEEFKKKVEEAIAKTIKNQSNASDGKEGDDEVDVDETEEAKKQSIANNNDSQQTETSLVEKYASAFSSEEILAE
jgi:hypothetical protein